MPIAGPLFRKYATWFAVVVTLGVLASGLVSLAFSYRDTRALIDEVQRTKARAAASTIAQFLETTQTNLRAVLLAAPLAQTDRAMEEQHHELIKLLRINSAVVDAAWIDANGVERMRLSRIAPDIVDGTRNRAGDPLVIAARRDGTAFGAVYFRGQTEPFMSVAAASGTQDAGIVIADINLKFVWDVVSAIRIGDSGYAYVIDGNGKLISHPDISLVLRQADVTNIRQVRALLGGEAVRGEDVVVSETAIDGTSRRSLAAWTSVPGPRWHVYVEQPVSEALAPVYATLKRTLVVLLASIALCVAVSVAFAKRMTAPIRALQSGAARIGEGNLEERVHVATGDELEILADEFNRMAGRLLESRSGLEQKIEERTHALAEANHAKSRFLAVASHDLRQPVHALGLFVAQAKETHDPAVREALIARIESSWQSISSLLDALLDVSKLDAGAVQVTRSRFDAQSLLDGIEQSFTVLAHAKGLRIRIRPSSLLLESDPQLVERVLLNLVANAVRYTQEGGVLIGVRRRGTTARIDVWDTGPGIPPDEQARIFDEFYRGGIGGFAGGMGLGLAIVKRLARLLDLELTLRSRPGKGSVFSVSIPLAPPGSIVDQAGAPDAVTTGFDGGVALVIDDDADALDAASGLLRQWGWSVVTASSAERALEHLAQLDRQPDLIISDYHLMGDNGANAVARIRAACGWKVPAVLVSADVTEGLRADAARLSVHLLHKPLQAAKLRVMLHHLRSEAVSG